MNLTTTMQVVPYLVRLFVKAQMEYRGAFVLDRIAQIVNYGAAYAAIWVLLERFDTLGGWTWSELALLLSFQLLAYALGASFSFTQFREMQNLVRNGTLEVLLVKPFSPWAYLAFSGFNIGYLGHVILGVGLIGWAMFSVDVAWNFGSIFYLAVTMLSAALVVCSIITMIGATAMILVRSNYLFSIFFGFWELTRYPLSIFPAPIQIILYTIIPMGFMAYVPTAFVLGKDISLLGDWGGWVAPFVGPVAALVAMAHWRYCIRHYQGGGG
jgi:ABC-2 type transport system permease protein